MNFAQMLVAIAFETPVPDSVKHPYGKEAVRGVRQPMPASNEPRISIEQQYLNALGDKSLSDKQICKILDKPSLRYVRETLLRLENKGIIERDGYVTNGNNKPSPLWKAVEDVD